MSGERQSNGGRSKGGGGGGKTSRADTAELLRTGCATFAELTGMEPESVISFAPREGGGWTLQVEVVELRRVPDTMSLLGSYELTLDADGGLTGYARKERYERGRADPRPRS
ncbi:gas vesicle protein [Streptomyces sp. NPDC048172]|uniref:gas vesicle protein GvpO n=1 Tax=Streptomyces sp. NPDC048172 TaxID=3365505 RepID=UPI0037180036